MHAFKCQRHCGDGAGAFRDNMQGGMRLLTTFVPACGHAFQALCPGVRSITQLSKLNFQGLVIFTDGGTEMANGDTTAGCARLGPILSRFYECVMFELVVTFHAHPAFSGASRHINNTDELSGFIIFVFKNFSQIKGLCLEVPCLYFVVPNNVSKLTKGITHPCSNVRPANLVQRSLQTVANRVRQSLNMFLVMVVTLATHVLIMPLLLEHSVTSPGTILKKKMACSTYQHGCNRGRFFFSP